MAEQRLQGWSSEIVAIRVMGLGLGLVCFWDGCGEGLYASYSVLREFDVKRPAGRVGEGGGQKKGGGGLGVGCLAAEVGVDGDLGLSLYFVFLWSGRRERGLSESKKEMYDVARFVDIIFPIPSRKIVISQQASAAHFRDKTRGFDCSINHPISPIPTTHEK